MFVSFGCHLALNWLRVIGAWVFVLASQRPTPKKAGKGTRGADFCQ
jgi:hypothetical protein